MAAAVEGRDEYGAFMDKFQLLPPNQSSQLPLHGLTFAVKDMALLLQSKTSSSKPYLGITGVTVMLKLEKDLMETQQHKKTKILLLNTNVRNGNGEQRGRMQETDQRFDIEEYVTGFGNPDWARTHTAATSMAPSVMAVLGGGATFAGKTVMDEMAYSINGENVHYGTPINPCAPDQVPGGSSSGSSVAVAAGLVDFSLGTDTGGSVRVPAAFCGILGFRPSHGIVSTDGVIPMAQSFDTVGWFSRDPHILSQVGHVLLQLPEVDPVPPTQVIIADDCFHLLNIPSDRVTHVLIKSIEKLFGYQVIHHAKLGDYVKDKVPSLNQFMDNDCKKQEYMIPSLMALSNALRYLQRYEFNCNHGEWVHTVKPDLGPGISERVWEAVRTTGENVEVCRAAMAELRSSLSSLLEGYGILAIPTVPGPPPKLHTEASALESFGARAFSLLAIAGMSGFCQVSIPLGMYNSLPVAVSLIARHGSDGFLLNLVKILYSTLKEQAQITEEP